MKVRVKYFSTYRHATGLSQELLALDDGQTVQDLLDILCDLHGELRSFLNEMMLSVNKEYADPHTELAEGDEVALLPPVSGG